MLYDGSASIQQFVDFGEGFTRELLIKRAFLAPSNAFLDLGCGNGSVARALTRVLGEGGRYEGVDVSRTSVEWLQAHYRAYPNFRFTHADVYNKMYNASGTSQPRDYRLPFPDASFDMVLLKSVFTHMLPDDLRAYLYEVSRVLKASGRAVISYFLLNDESKQHAAAQPGAVKMPLDFEIHGDPLCRVKVPEVPEIAVGHDEARIRGYYREAGLSVAEIAYGDWCGRPTLLGLQDLVIALKV